MLAVLIVLLVSCYLALQNSWIQTKITQSIANRLSKDLNTTISVGRVDIGFFNKLHLEDVLIEDQNNDTLLFTKELVAKIDTLKFRKQKLSIQELHFSGNQLNIVRDSANSFNFSFIGNAIGKRPKDSTRNWMIKCRQFDFGNLNISYNDIYNLKQSQFFVRDLNLDVTDFISVSDSFSCQINKLSMNDGQKLELKNLSTNIKANNKTIQLNNLHLQSRYSDINKTDILLNLPVLTDTVKQPASIDLQVGESEISFIELGELIPALKGMRQSVHLSGQVYGNINDLKGRNIVFETGQETKTDLDFYINDLTDPENMYLFLDLKESKTSFTDLSSIHLPNSSSIRYLEFPKSFYDAGILKFKGNFSGFLSDFVTFGTLQSEMGTLSTDILVVPEKDDTVYYRGNISTTSFDLGSLFQNNELGNLTFTGSVDGNYIKNDQSVSGIFKGDIAQIDINQYSYKDIKFDGILLNRMFDGLLAMDDPNLKFSFLGQVDLNNEIPDFDFKLHLDKALPGNLNLSESFPDAEVAFKMKANFKGNEIDNMDGTISVHEGYYKNKNGRLNLDGINLKTHRTKQNEKIEFDSDFFDFEIDGHYHFRSIRYAIKKALRHFLPSIPVDLPEDRELNTFTYKLNVEDANPLTKVFAPGLELETPFLLYGQIDTPNDDIQLNGSIPGFKYNKLWARNIYIGNKSVDNQYSSKFRIGEIFMKNGLQLYNFSIDSKISEDVIDNTISWSNFDELTYSGSVKTRTTFASTDSTKHPQIQIEGFPSKIYIADSLWTINPFSAIIDSSTITINNFKIENKDQALSIDGQMRQGKSNLINIDLKDINLAHLGLYLNKELETEGIVNGKFGFANIMESPVILSDLSIDKLIYKNQLMGDITLTSQWNRNNSAIDSELKIVRDNRLNLNAFGFYKPATKELSFDINTDSVSLIVLETFIRNNFSDFKGYGTGKVRLEGTTDKILLNGALMGSNAGLRIDATQVPYSFSDSVYFNNDTILFDNITVFDEQGNSGNFNGTIVHDNFKEMLYDLNFNSNKILALNTTSRDNDKFYGKAVGRGRINISGEKRSVDITGSLTSLNGTEVNISMEDETEIEQYEFLEFVSTAESKKEEFFEEKKKENSSLTLGFNIEATPAAKVQLIYNSQIGDVIKAQGEGILLFNMNKEYDITLSGNYTPTKGDYLFTFQNVINKRFTIEPGGSIVWSGDPYNAVIDLTAIYKLKASLYDLMMDANNTSQNQRIQVECLINLKDELINPTIGFDINFPNADESTKDRLLPYFNTEEEKNKQIFFLVALGKFYTPEHLRGQFEAQNTNMLGTTASELFSNQLSNMLSQIDDRWDVGLNYRPGNEITDDEIELALSTQIFNDRVTLNGNVGNNTDQFNTNSSQIVGDFEVNVKLVPSGKIQFKAYSRSNNNLIFETAPYTQGIGLSFKEEYNSIDELFEKFKNLFKKKNKKKE